MDEEKEKDQHDDQEDGGNGDNENNDKPNDNPEDDNGNDENNDDANDNQEEESSPDEEKSERDPYEDDDDYIDDEYSYPEDEDDEGTEDQEPVESSAEGEEEEEETDHEKAADEEDESEEPEAEKEKRMPFLDHLEELRWTILRSMIAVLISAVICYIFSKQIVTFLRQPGPEDLKLIFLSPTEGFMIYIKVSIFAGLVVALPYVAYEFWKFIVPGLLEKEKKLVKPIAFFTVLCFATGAAFAYFVIIPFGLRFLLSFQTDFLEANITIGKYLGFVVTLILVFGVVFELPVLSFFLTKMGILNPEFLKAKRRYGIVIIFIMAAVLTPPDIFTQLMLAAPLIILYEVSIWVSRIASRKAKEEQDEENDLAG